MQQEVNISGEELLALIPQRDPMIMIDHFAGINHELSHTSLHIKHDNLFCAEGVLQEYGVIEHIAQSAAARIGYIYHCRGEAIPLGFIGSIDKMTIYSLPFVGSILHTEVQVEQEVGDITLISARVVSNEGLIAEGKMKIFLKKENHEEKA